MANRRDVKRREFLQVAAGTAASSALLPSALASAKAPAEPARQPNLVFLLADQWRAQATGYTGDPNARTPQIDRLAAQSVDFSNAISGCPVCCPYRGSLLTGRYPLTHGVFLNDVCLSNDAVSIAQAYNRAGYQTGYIGKWHLDGHGRSSFVPPERRQGFQFWRAAECTHDYNRSHFYGDEPVKRFWKGYDAIAQTEEARQYIRRNQAEPFALFVSWGPPHNPYETAPEEYRARFEADKIVLRANVPKESQEAARRDLAGYYAHLAALDDCVGRVVETLAECALEDDTILVFTSDHGDMLGSQGEIRKQRPWDESIRVPFLLRYPGRLGRDGRKRIAPLNTPDIMPTLLGLSGIEVPETVEGTNRRRLITGETPDGDEAALITCPSPFGEWPRARGGREYRGLRTARYTYVRALDGPWLLYDNQRDPYQLENLVGRAEHASLQSELESTLSRRLEETGDAFRPGGEYVAQWGYKTNASGTVPYTN
jgi:arylsulfatase A-like enzyme